MFFGGSSWKYEGWLGQIYDSSRYETRGKFAKTRFEKECLSEYAETFSSVCGDFTFYTFYSREFFAKLFAQVPSTFRFGFKVPEVITNPSPHSSRSSYAEERHDYLNPEITTALFLERLAPFAKQIGYLVFEFVERRGATPDDNKVFLDQLDTFFEKLPKFLPYSVEIRTKSLLGPEYFAVLRKHGVAHCFNSWTRMPSIGEQLEYKDAFTAGFSVARLLLRPGNTYNKAVKSFEPFDSIKDPYPQGYSDAARLATTARAKQLWFAFAVNNRLTGNAPQTVEAIMDELDK